MQRQSAYVAFSFHCMLCPLTVITFMKLRPCIPETGDKMSHRVLIWTYDLDHSPQNLISSSWCPTAPKMQLRLNSPQTVFLRYSVGKAFSICSRMHALTDSPKTERLRRLMAHTHRVTERIPQRHDDRKAVWVYGVLIVHGLVSITELLLYTLYKSSSVTTELTH